MMTDLDFEHPLLRLESHPTARSQAVARSKIPAATLIFHAPPLSTALLPAEKNRRCDFCHTLQTESTRLAKCTGCASYWYCGLTCQRLAWSKHHRSICKTFPRYTASTAYERLLPHERMDALLLSQLAAEYLPLASEPTSDLATLLSLMPSKSASSQLPALPLSMTTDSRDVLLSLYSRFANNNFLLHSHLVSFAHGIYPLASRLFNHSCTPNAVVRYSIVREQPVLMEVVALRDILPGEEICIPYVDPALPLEDRDRALDVSFGFTCTCSLCVFQRQIEIPTMSAEELTTSIPLLREYTGCLPSRLPPQYDALRDHQAIPDTLHPFFGSTVLPKLSEAFSKSSHDGSVTEALPVGRTLLALYFLLYPPNYPQIGLHALECAKTAWNAVITNEEAARDPRNIMELLATAEWYLAVAHHILNILGPEGDDGGPLAEIILLQSLIKEELMQTTS